MHRLLIVGDSNDRFSSESFSVILQGVDLYSLWVEIANRFSYGVDVDDLEEGQTLTVDDIIAQVSSANSDGCAAITVFDVTDPENISIIITYMDSELRVVTIQ